MRRTRIQGLMVVAMIIVAIASVAQTSSAAVVWNPEPPTLQYTTVDGLSQSDVLDIVQDQAGHLWLATHRGLNRYDGSEFLNFTKADGLLHNGVTALLVTDSGQIWFSDINANLLMIDNDVVSRVVSIKELQDFQIIQLVQFGDRIILVTEESGLFSLDANNMEASPKQLIEKGESIRNVDVRDGALWLIRNETLVRWDGDVGSAFEVVQENVVGSAIYDQNTHWLVLSNNDIGRLSENGFVPVHSLPDGEEFSRVAAGSNGRVWVASEEQLFSFQQTTDVHGVVHNENTSLADFSRVNKLFIDREDTLWAGHYGGLYRHLGHRFQHYKNVYSGNSKSIWTIAEDEAGNFYYGSTSTLLRRAVNGEVTDYSALIGIPSGSVRDIVRIGDSVLFAAVIEVGVFRIDTLNDTAQLIEGTAGLQTLDMEIDANGVIWIATDGSGILSVDTKTPGVARSYTQTGDGVIYTLTIDPAGSVWYGVDELGLGVLRKNSAGEYIHQFYGSESGLTKLLFSQVIAVGVNKLWIGGEDSVLLHFEDGIVRNYTADSPMRDQNIYTVFVSDDGTLLLGGENGVSSFNPETLESRELSLLHGFLGVEVNVHTNFVDSEGYLWFGTIDGPTRMDLNAELPARTPMVPQIVSAKSQHSQTMLASGEHLEYSERGIQFKFDAVSLMEPFAVQYSYRLRGHNSEWSSPDRSRSVNYSGLAPGRYQFEVRARYGVDEWSVSEEAFRLEVLAPFWLTSWFLVSAAIASMLILYLGIYLRTRGIERLNLRLRAEVADRTRSIEKGREQLIKTNRQLLAESEERRRSDSARAEVETRFRVAFQSTPIGMALVDTRGNVLNSNFALRKMFLAPKNHDDDDAQMNALTLIVDEDEKEAVSAGFFGLLKGESDSFDGEHLCTRFDGEELHIHLFMTAIRDEDGVCNYCMAQVQDITESRRLTSALEYQANYDELSGLLNRRSFEKQLDRAYVQSVNAKVPSYLMFMDLDQFKVVNDTSGHGAGDEMLRQISELIKDQVRTDDTVGRLGGDEFGLILWRCPTHVAYRIAESIRSAIEQFQFRWGTNTYRVGMSIGAVTIDSALGTTAEIQQLADAACYHSKDNGRNRVHFLQEEGESISEQRGEVRWVQRLHEAMDHNSFALYGQFIKPADPLANEPERVEILLRMRDLKTRKIIPPGAFLPAAERYGLITKLDKWVVENLLKTLWVHRSFGSKDRRYWVNLSGTSIGDKRFVDFLIDAIANCGLPEGMVNFEITETAVIRNVGEAGRLMSALHGMGCQFALDDFGSGLSSFGYLKKLPVDYIKIDGMFVRDILTDEIDRVFVRSIIDIARTMGIKSIAEFVENDEIFKAVGDLGVDYVQGFGVHRPEAIFADLSDALMLGPMHVHKQFDMAAVGAEKMA